LCLAIVLAEAKQRRHVRALARKRLFSRLAFSGN
jgi:hypothetical protein